MLLEIAIADAYGAGFEFAKPDVLARRPNDFTRYFRHNLDDNLPGMYTDDTQMSLGLARWLLTVTPQTLSRTQPRDIAWFFVDTFQRDPRQAYSRRMFNFLKAHPDVDDFLAAIDPVSTRSGAAMRSAILGVLPTLGDVVRIASMQAKITHNTPEGIATAVAVSSAAWHIRHGSTIEQAIAAAQMQALKAATNSVDLIDPGQSLEFMEAHNRFWKRIDLSVTPMSPVSYHGVPCVQAAFHALLAHFDDPIAMLQAIVSYAGDTDTVAAIAMGIRSMAPGPTLVWPQWCYDTLENGSWGLDYLIDIDEKISVAWPLFEDQQHVSIV